MSRFLVILSLVAALIFASGCTRKAEMHRAQQLEQQGRPSQALEIYKSQFATTPEYQRSARANLQYHIGECLLALGRTREAFSAYSKAVDIDDSNQPAHLRLGEMYLLSGSGEGASEQAQAVLKAGEANLDGLALLGEAAAANGNSEVAEKAFETVLKKDPSRTKVSLALADVLNRDNQPDRAREVLMQASKAKPGSSAPWIALGRIEETLGNIKAAQDAYEKAVKVEDTPETNLRLAQYLERTAHVEEAKAILLHVDSLRPTFATANADFALISDRSGEAREGYLIALNGLSSTGNYGPDRSRTIARLIEADLAGENAKADATSQIAPVNLAQRHLDYFRKEIDPATLQILQAEIALAGNDLPTAVVHADAAVQLAPDSAPAQYIAGSVKFRSGDSAGARSAWESGLGDDSDHIPTRLALAQLSLDQHDLKGALGYVVPVVRDEPGNYRALMLFGRVLLEEKQFGSAEIIAARAEVVAPAANGPDLLRGEIALANKDPGKALIEFQKAVLRDPNSEEAVEGLARAYRGGTVSRDMLLNIERMALQDPPSATLLEITGRLYAERNMNDDARRAFGESLRLNPARTSAARQLANVLAQSGHEQEAAQYAELVPGISQLIAGVKAEQSGQLQSAIDHYEVAFRAGDPSGVAANNLAWLYAQLQTKLDRALVAALRAVELAPREPSVMDTLGYVYLRRHEYSHAVRTLKEARDLARQKHSPEMEMIDQHLRLAYLNAGQPEQAEHLADGPVAR